LVDGKRVLLTGGTGSLGRVILRRLLAGEFGRAQKIVVFSRDEKKQHDMRTTYAHNRGATDQAIPRDCDGMLEFRIGDVRDFHSVAAALQTVDLVLHAAALKQVPTCEYAPFEAVLTNVVGAENVVRAIEQHSIPVETVVGMSTDKACKPVNVMGMTKSIQERIFIQANMRCPNTRFVCVRYGNVLASRGSVIPFFREQIRQGGPVTITSPDMTRFLLTLDTATETVFSAVREAHRGEIYIPRVSSARVVDIAAVMIGDRRIETVVTGIRPGEKIDEILVSEEERFRTVERGEYYVIRPSLSELRDHSKQVVTLSKEYSSRDHLMDREALMELLGRHGLLSLQAPGFENDG